MKEKLKEFLKCYEKEILDEADAMREEPMPELTEELFSLFEKTGNRLQYGNRYFYRRKFLAVFGMAVFVGRRREDIGKLCEVIRNICGEFCWALPAHVDRKANPESWKVTVDLFACETAFAFSEIEESCGEVLPEELKQLMRKNILERILLPFERSAIPCGIWECSNHNWNAVCGGSVGCAAIHMWKEEEPERLERLLARLLDSLTCYVDGFADDGTCLEGVGYFVYGMSFYTAFAEKLERYTQGRIDLMAGEKLAKMMEFQQKCYFPGGLAVNFSDCGQERFRVGMTCYMAQKNAEVKFPPMELAAHLNSDTCYRWASLYRDYVFTKNYIERLDAEADDAAETVAAAEGKETSDSGAEQITLKDAQWTICSGAHQCAMAAIGGDNGGTHNHNDVGSFHYVVGDEMFLADLGAGEYTKEYFRDETRYTIFVNQSLSHNIPMINGHGQLTGKEYRCSRFVTDGKGGTEIAFEKAYGEAGLRSCLRRMQFSGMDGSLEVTDLFEFEPGNETETAAGTVTENLVTPWKPEVNGSEVVLTGKRSRCVVSIDGEAEIRVERKTYSDHGGSPAEAWLVQWPVLIQSGCGRAKFEIRRVSEV